MSIRKKIEQKETKKTERNDFCFALYLLRFLLFNSLVFALLLRYAKSQSARKKKGNRLLASVEP